MVVIQNDLFNASRLATVLVCPLTSNLQRAASPENVRLEAQEAGLGAASVALLGQVQAVDRSQLEDYRATLPLARVQDLLAGLRLVTGGAFNPGAAQPSGGGGGLLGGLLGVLGA